jgi:hypothetical protein
LQRTCSRRSFPSGRTLRSNMRGLFNSVFWVTTTGVPRRRTHRGSSAAAEHGIIMRGLVAGAIASVCTIGLRLHTRLQNLTQIARHDMATSLRIGTPAPEERGWPSGSPDCTKAGTGEPKNSRPISVGACGAQHPALLAQYDRRVDRTPPAACTHAAAPS